MTISVSYTHLDVYKRQLFDYTWVLNFHWLIYLLSTVLLGMVLLFGVERNGATRWINIGFQFQPSDVAKILLILFFAKFFEVHEDEISKFRMIVPVSYTHLPRADI